MPTCTAPTPPTISGATGHLHQAAHWHRHQEPAHCEQHRNEHGRSACQGVPWFGYCPAPAPLTCQGPTTWPPPTAHQTYAEDRRLGQRVPPSVSTWRPEDVRRQQEADARIRARASERPVAVAPGEGPTCEPEPCRPAHMIGVRS